MDRRGVLRIKIRNTPVYRRKFVLSLKDGQIMNWNILQKIFDCCDSVLQPYSCLYFLSKRFGHNRRNFYVEKYCNRKGVAFENVCRKFGLFTKHIQFSFCHPQQSAHAFFLVVLILVGRIHENPIATKMILEFATLLVVLEWKSFASACPSGCVCSNTKVTCKVPWARSMPPLHLPQNTTVLDLSSKYSTKKSSCSL